MKNTEETEDKKFEKMEKLLRERINHFCNKYGWSKDYEIEHQLPESYLEHDYFDGEEYIEHIPGMWVVRIITDSGKWLKCITAFENKWLRKYDEILSVHYGKE